MYARSIVLAVVILLSACGSDNPADPEAKPVDPGAVVPASNSNLGLSADTICMQSPLGGADPREDDVRITSLTGTEISGLTATITYGPGQPTGWLTTRFDKTTTPARLWFHATTGTVPEGAWWADVSVSAPGGGEARVIRMHFTVLPPATPATATVSLHLLRSLNDYDPGAGTITGSGFDCRLPDETGVCSQQLPVGSTFTLTVTPDAGSFMPEAGWQIQPGDSVKVPCLLPNTCEQVVTGAGLIINAAIQLNGWNFTVAAQGAQANGNIEVASSYNGPPINCVLTDGAQSGPCGGFQSFGTRSIVLVPHPAAGSVFVGWSGDCTVAGDQCTLPTPGPDGHRSATATFAKQ